MWGSVGPGSVYGVLSGLEVYVGFVGPGSVYGVLLKSDKNGRVNRTHNFLWHAEH